MENITDHKPTTYGKYYRPQTDHITEHVKIVPTTNRPRIDHITEHVKIVPTTNRPQYRARENSTDHKPST